MKTNYSFIICCNTEQYTVHSIAKETHYHAFSMTFNQAYSSIFCVFASCFHTCWPSTGDSFFGTDTWHMLPTLHAECDQVTRSRSLRCLMLSHHCLLPHWPPAIATRLTSTPSQAQCTNTLLQYLFFCYLTTPSCNCIHLSSLLLGGNIQILEVKIATLQISDYL